MGHDVMTCARVHCRASLMPFALPVVANERVWFLARFYFGDREFGSGCLLQIASQYSEILIWAHTAIQFSACCRQLPNILKFSLSTYSHSVFCLLRIVEHGLHSQQPLLQKNFMLTHAATQG